MIDLPPETQKTVRKILEEYLPLHTEVWAFGFRVTGRAKPYSDLDLVVIGTQKLDFTTLGRLKDAFEESDLSIRVDIVDWNAISPDFRAVIEQKKELVWRS